MNKPQRRYIRTVILGVLAMAALVWAAVEQFGIPAEEIKALFLATLAGVGLIIAAAALAVSLWLGLKYLLGRRGGDE